MHISLEHLEKEIEAIKTRNTRVESEKKWETSWQKRISTVTMTYFVMIIIFWSLDNSEPFLNAIIPTVGYTLSTLSMGWIKIVFLNK